MSEHDSETEYGLVMPFVVVKSKGGPHDDGAFVAGFRLGQIWQVLEPDGAGWTGLVREDDMPQLDLIAMHHHCEVERTDAPGGWVHVKIARWIS